MKKKVLVISVCAEKMHELEFVRPIEDILRKEGKEFQTNHYLDVINEEDLRGFSHVIICGTSLKDMGYFDNINGLSWIENFEGPIIGICAGMQILVKYFGRRLFERGKRILDREEIGMVTVNFSKEFLGFKGNKQVYALHKLGIGKRKDSKDDYATSSKGIQALKWGDKPIYGVLFHPEVRNKELIVNFINL